MKSFNALLTAPLAEWEVWEKPIYKAEKDDDGNPVLDWIMHYTKHTCVINRLNAVCGVLGWQAEYHHQPNGVRCRLSIADPNDPGRWVGKTGGIAYHDSKSPYSTEHPDAEALKRAAYMWGVGLELYGAGVTRFECEPVDEEIMPVLERYRAKWIEASVAKGRMLTAEQENPFDKEAAIQYAGGDTERRGWTFDQALCRAGWLDWVVGCYAKQRCSEVMHALRAPHRVDG